MDGVAVSEVSYDVDGWGTGTLWFADGVLVWHELPSLRIDSLPLGAPQPTTRFLPASTQRAAARETLPRVQPRPATTLISNAKNVTRVRPDRDKSVTIAPQIVDRLRRYFAGERIGFDDVAIDLDWCTPFQRAVADTLRAVPRGEVVSYGELAALAGYPNAQRAAGTFCAQNRLSLLIPCHRVVAAGGIGSYGLLGTAFKQRLLALEGVSM